MPRVFRVGIGFALAVSVGVGVSAWHPAPAVSIPDPHATAATDVSGPFGATAQTGPAPVVPEAPIPVLLPLTATGAAIAAAALIRRR